MGLREVIVNAGKAKMKTLKDTFSIPSRSESMAGVIIFYVFTNSIATSVWMFNAWSPFIFVLFNHNNLYVGLMSAVNGVFEMAVAFLSGSIADKVWGPSKTLRVAVCFGLVTLSIVLIAVWVGNLYLLILAQVFEGTYMGLSFTCLESVFAQCLRRGERDRLYSVKFSCEAGGPIIGVILSIILYSIVGSEWRVSVLRWVMTAGLAVHLGSLTTFLLTFKPLPWQPPPPVGAVDVVVEWDKGATWDSVSGSVYDCEDPRIYPSEGDDEPSTTSFIPGPTTEAANRARTAVMQSRGGPPLLLSQYEPSVLTAHDNNNDVMSMTRNDTFHATAGDAASTRREGVEEASERGGDLDGPGSPVEGVSGAAAGPSKTLTDREIEELIRTGKAYYVDDEYEKSTGFRRKVMKCLPITYYPFFVVIADLILVVGSGMTTQYFPMFMMVLYDVGPIMLSVLNLCNSLVITVMAVVNGFLGQRYGRVRAMLPPKLIAAMILLWMALARGTKYGPKTLMCIAYVLRNAFMNCSAGLSRALLMDLVPEHKRGRWNAIESVQSAGWSGTAVLGGYLADRWGYGTAFIFTFFFHLSACLLLMPLTVRNDSRLPRLVFADQEPKREDSTAANSGTAVQVNSESEKGSGMKRSATVVELTEANVKRIASSATLCRERAQSKEDEGTKDEEHDSTSSGKKG